MDIEDIIVKALSKVYSKYYVLTSCILYLILNAIITIMYRNKLYNDLATIPGGYRVLIAAFLLSVILIGSISSFLHAAGIRLNFLKTLYLYILPVFLYFVAVLAYGFHPRFMYELPGFTKAYLQVNVMVLVLLPIWASYIYGEHRRQFENIRKNIKDSVRNSFKDLE